MFADVTDHAGNQVFKFVATAHNLSPGQCAAGKVRLERLDETALFLGLEISLDGRGAGKTKRSARTGFRFRLLEIKYRTKRLDLRAQRRERSELDFGALIQESDGTIGGAEVESDGIR